jgi:hypothetical protein
MESEMSAAQSENKYSEAGVALVLRPSRTAAWAIGAAAAATLALLATAPGPGAARILAATWVACAALESIHSRALLRGRRAVRALRVAGREVEVEDGMGTVRAGELRAGSFVAPWLTVLRWRPHGARVDRTVPMLPGMVEAEGFRRLRVALRWG